MKRLEALAPLSRDHHATLLLAQLLKKGAPKYRGLPTEQSGKIAYAKQQFEQHIKKHFMQEEALLEKVKDTNAEIGVIAAEIKAEHDLIRKLFAKLDVPGDEEHNMNMLAISLQTHIRKEERVLFPLLQQHCSEAQLQQIHELLH